MNARHFIFIIVAIATTLSGSRAWPAVLEEVVVTAQKREQNLQDVPIAVTAFDSTSIERLGINAVYGLRTSVPSLDISDGESTGFPAITLRGIGIDAFTGINDPSVAVYVDEVPLASLAQLQFVSFDMDNIEVLKGPQGTLFGRNTTGGLIHFKTRKPTQEFESYAKLKGGDHGKVGFEGAVSGPLTDTLAGRLSVNFKTFDGYYFNRVSGKDLGGADTYSARAQLLWEPTDSASVRFTIHYDRQDGETIPFEQIPMFDPATGGVCPALAALAGGTKVTGESFQNALETAQATCADALGYSDPDGDPFAVDYRANWGTAGHDDIQSYGFQVHAVFDIGATTLTSVTAFERTKFRGQEQQYGGPTASIVDFDARDIIAQFSEEARLAGNSFGDRLDWVAGGFFSFDNIEAPLPGAQLLGFPGILPPTLWELDSTQDTLSGAVFGHGEWSFSDKFSFNAGLRFTWDQKDFTGRIHYRNDAGFCLFTNPALVAAGEQPEGCTPGVTPASALITLADVNKRRSSTDLSGTIGLNYRPREDWLLYVKYSRGFKSGGFFSGFAQSNPELGGYKPERINAIEGGFKTDLFQRSMRANAAVFYYDRMDTQAFDVTFPPSGIPVQQLTNVGDAEVVGAELEIEWLPIENLEFKGGASWLHTNMTTGNFKGNDLQDAPEITANLLGRYTFHLVDFANLSAQVDARFTDERFRNTDNLITVGDAFGGPSLDIPDVIEAKWRVNLRLELASPDHRWELAGWIRNLTDEEETNTLFEIIPTGTILRTTMPPRTYGASLTYRWE